MSSMIPTLLAASLLLGMVVPIALAQDDGELRGDTGIIAADPSVIRTADGLVAVESLGGHSLVVRLAPDLAGLAKAKKVRVWSDRDKLGEVWAPEIVFRDGRYEIHFAAGRGSAHRMYKISSGTADADYGEAIPLALPEDKWAIDGMPFRYRGVDYFVWSGWAGDTDVRQDLYLVRLDAEGQPQGQRVLIASPDQPWENVAGETPTINEGPQPIVDPDGQLHVVYSANGSWGPNYCLADLRLKAGADPMDPAGWSKSPGCLFGANPETLAPDGTRAETAKGVGHHSFILPDGDVEQGGAAGEQPLPFLFHGVPAEQEPSNFWAARKWFAGRYQWVPDVAYGAGDKADSGWSLRFAE
ncbi:MAG TPA: glycoside hydrolase family 43 protein [Devosia sp.]|uniref:glycoside hydrolase family 43 protein n=1 Tax=Devosia sp. TaxID=1871048 RepID=UPI002F932CF0